MRANSIAVIALLLASCVGCTRQSGQPASVAKSPTVASLVPSATELIVDMGAGDHLVAVSDYDQLEQVANLPKVGAYQSVDWEKLAVLRPNFIITYYGAGKTPAGFLQKTSELKIEQLNLKLNRLEDIYSAIEVLGQACGEVHKADAEMTRIRTGVDAVRRQYADATRVRSLIVLGPSGRDVVGRETYLDDLLQVAGGENAVKVNGYVTLDREAILSLRPEVILLLLPDADHKTVESAQQIWFSVFTQAAIRDQRLCVFTASYMTRPDSHLPEEARKFAAALHPEVRTLTTQPTNQGMR